MLPTAARRQTAESTNRNNVRRVNVDGFIDSSVHRKIGLLITIKVQRRNMDATLNRSLPNRCPDDFATNRDFAWQSHVHGNQLHVTMTRRTEFTASI